MSKDEHTDTDSVKKEDDSEMKPSSSAEASDQGKDDNNDGDTVMKEAKESEDTMESEEEKAAAAKKAEEERKKKYADWPLHSIKEPHDNDVMYGRGGGTNHHPGNKRYRKMVEDRKLDYVNSKRLDKPLVALDIIRQWRAQEPPGRFLKLDEKTGLWNDVGDKKAREKTSQALREKAPLIRKQQEEERAGKEEKDPDKDEKADTKSTRFADGTKTESATVKKAVLARDHSLGREYLHAGESVSLEGFSWQDPFQAKAREEAPHTINISPTSSAGTPTNNTSPPPPQPPPHAYPPGRNSSHGSAGMAPPHHASIGGPPPPAGGYYTRMSSEERHRQYSWGRQESWGTPYAYPPPPPPPGGPGHQRSNSWTNAREHSLSHNPLANANLSQPANRSAFDSSRSNSGYWGEPMAPTKGTAPPPPPPPSSSYASGPPPPQNAPQHAVSPPYRTPSGGRRTSPPRQYSVDPSIAHTWSGQRHPSVGEIQRSWSQDSDLRRSWSADRGGMARSWSRDYQMPLAGNEPSRSPVSQRNNNVPRPQIVKRDTSHQNENYETKPSVKRAALNRDNSMASNRLKQRYLPEYYNEKFDTEREMRMLSDNFEQSTLGSASKPKPKSLTPDERMSTLEGIAMDLMVKPAPLMDGNRTSTIDALNLDLDDDPILQPSEFERSTTMDEAIADLKKGIEKPKTINSDNRMTTSDFMNLVGDPLPVDSAETGKLRPIDLTEDPGVTNDWLASV